ncbi:MAG: lipoyl(octanoyl) transferase LipB [Solirubrobacterales bacterium]|nr:lipoyl(octanoyl) transferase LipB [Solirubrobacterales bacterium]
MAALNDGQIGIVDLGLRPYPEMTALQERLVESRRSGQTGDLLLILEHPATYTRGRRSDPGDLLYGPEELAERGIEVCDTPRGGKVTYHAPGQLVMYPLIDLRGIGDQPGEVDRIDVAGFVASLETAMSAALAGYNIDSAAIDGLTGLWVSHGAPIPADATAASMGGEVAAGKVVKIGSIGLRISRGISSHGLSLNVSCDLQPFEGITSCGIEHCRVSSIESETGSAPPVSEVGSEVGSHLANRLGLDLVPLEPVDIGLETAASATA